ncbi:MAG: HyaD/HybD family hydrogenase maturation endopeptidase [Burkholderiaceae bacterium]
MPSACAPSEPAAAAPRRVVVLGIGNTILGDDGVGVHAALALQQGFELPPGVQVIDGGTAGMELLDPLAELDLLLVLDAVKAPAPPGSLVCLKGAEVPVFFRSKLSPHQVSICDVLASLEFAGVAPRELLLVGVVPEVMDLSLALSDSVAAKVPAMVDAALEALAEHGLAARPRVH